MAGQFVDLVTVVALQTPVPTILSRNRRREHPVPAEVLGRQLDSFEWPTADEAHHLEVVRPQARRE